MGWHQIPIENIANQEFDLAVEADGRVISLRVHLNYNTEGGFWRMDISDGITGEALVCNIPLVTGEYPAADLMAPFQYMGLGSVMILQVSEDTYSDGDIPDLNNLGTDYLMVWGDSIGE